MMTCREGLVRQHTWKMSRFCRRSGRGNSIFRSRRPGRSRAGSSVSWRLVAMITFTLTVWSKPAHACMALWHCRVPGGYYENVHPAWHCCATPINLWASIEPESCRLSRLRRDWD